MKYAADFRMIARDALRGRWPVAILTGFVASLIGAGIATGGGSSSSSSNNSTRSVIRDFQATEFWAQFRTLIIIAIVVLVIWLIITIVIGGAGKLGYAIFNLKLVDNSDAEFKDLFSQFHRLGDGFYMNFLTALYTILWTLLFIIPGIIKTYSYAMTPYILAENPGMTATDAITESRRIMDGNKFRLFCLSISFIGWCLLCAAPMLIALIFIARFAVNTHNLAVFLWLIPASVPTLIGSLFLNPYMEASWAAFYRDVSGTEVVADPALPESSMENTCCFNTDLPEQFQKSVTEEPTSIFTNEDSDSSSSDKGSDTL